MQPPEGVRGGKSDSQGWQLHKLLYGLKQAGRQWKVKLDSAMDSLGFKRSLADDCLYTLRSKGKSVKLVVLVYMDDIVIAAAEMETIKWFKTALEKCFKLTDLGELKHILGIQVKHNWTTRMIWLDQTAYILALLEKHGMQDCQPMSTPIAPKKQLSATQSPSTLTDARAYSTYTGTFSYLECLGGILYATQM